jgi:hypothetical protein
MTFRLKTAVFLISLSSLAYEVLLTRIFSISQWNHLSFMVISIALFGFAGSGTSLSLLDAVKKGWEIVLTRHFVVSLVFIGYFLSGVGALILMNHLPLDYFRLPMEPVQALYLLVVYLSLSLPFFLTGLILSAAFAAFPQKSGAVYFSSMTGSAVGAILPGFLLPVFDEGKLAIIIAAIPLTAIFVFKQSAHEKYPQYLLSLLSIGFIVVCFWLITCGTNCITAVSPSPYKALSQTLRLPDTRIVQTSRDIRGRLDLVKGPYFRFAPGLSLQYHGGVRAEGAAYIDGDNPRYIFPIQSKSDIAFARYSLSYLGYVPDGTVKNVLLISSGGSGLAPICAVLSGAENILMLEFNPQVAELLSEHYPFAVSHKHAISFLSSSESIFSVIHVESWGVSVPGADALSQNSLFTVEAFVQFLNHLKDDGRIIISRKLLLPPSDMLRLFATAFEALKAVGKQNPEKYIAIFRNFDTYTMLISKDPFIQLEAVNTFARTMNFDPVFYDNINAATVNVFNRFEQPFHHVQIMKLLEALKYGKPHLYYESYPLDISPQHHDRPYPGRLFKWTAIRSLYEITGSRFYSLMLSGEVVVMVVFFEACLVSFILLGLPLALYFRTKKARNTRFFVALYFFGLGSGFMFSEMYGIKTATMAFGDPVISLTVTLAGLLICSGLGGAISQKLHARHLKPCLACLIFAFVGAYLFSGHWLQMLYNQTETVRYLLFLFPLAPVGILMGIPFSLGMRHLAGTPSQRAIAWSANGCASVMTAVVSAQIGLTAGIFSLMLFAASGYLVGFLVSVTSKLQ